MSVTSTCIYATQYFLFHNPKDSIFYLLQDLAFVPVQAIIVTLVLNKMIYFIEKKSRLKKINVIISAFFAEAGISILFALSEQNRNHGIYCKIIEMIDLPKKNLKEFRKIVDEFDYRLNVTPKDLERLKEILLEKKFYMISMLENTNLLEHDSFTDMLWAVFHVADELKTRDDLKQLSDEDITHLSRDILRAYKMMIVEWVNYVKYLSSEYPYLYAMAVRKNPFSNTNC